MQRSTVVGSSYLALPSFAFVLVMLSDMSRFVLNWVTARDNRRCTFRNFAIVGEYGAGGNFFSVEPAWLEAEINLSYRSSARVWFCCPFASKVLNSQSFENQLWSLRCFVLTAKYGAI